ncbi:hypothetical protein EYF80_009510 [Liparis tanakae]|uniref:Uncharacterized protein n=1 Tax=Liparis tanakae TaxID=230148 RepID=A0A4Z2IQJ6_9TELE|nr:hypothetical protein EYF80_009510 [Liparis tanakae]
MAGFRCVCAGFRGSWISGKERRADVGVCVSRRSSRHRLIPYALRGMTIPAAGEALKGLVGRQEASTSTVHLDYLNNQHKKTHLIE